MPLPFGNCDYQFRTPQGKPVFVPSIEGRKLGAELKSKIEKLYVPPSYFYHLAPGGHISALHAHRNNAFFARTDLENFFYSISRNRAARSLQQLGFSRPQAERYSKCSTVKNPYGQPSYSLPYGFIQSPILASVVLTCSEVGSYLQEIGKSATISVYVDDIVISGDDLDALSAAYQNLGIAIVNSGFAINVAKSLAPTYTTEVFNCNIRKDQTTVKEARKKLFYAEPRTAKSMLAFDAYCDAVSRGNIIAK